MVGGVLEDLTTLDARLDVGLPARLELGVSLPITLDAGFAAPYSAERSGAAGGDLGLELRWNALARGGKVAGVTLGVGMTAPTGDARRLAGADAFTVSPTIVADALVGRLRFAATGGGRLRSRASTFEYATVHQELLYGASAEVGLDPARRFILSAELAGAVDPSSGTGPVEALGGLRYGGDSLALILAGGAGLDDGIGAPDFRLLAGVAFRSLRTRDADDDRVADDVDRCPSDPEDRDGHGDADGCPDPDDDGDGVADGADACPQVAEDHDGFEDADGCPDDDNDHDGIPDRSDRCVAQAEDGDGFQDLDGCPDPDNDGDGVADAADRCPAQPESANGFQDQDGCPDQAPRFVFRPRERLVFDNIEFRTNSDELLATSLPILDEVAASMRAQPDVRVRIEGNTDDRGPDDRNLSLSQRRALSVMNYLIGAGIEARRMESAGSGETRPVDTNATEEGRAKNRRVEFLTLDQ
jgi:outer membrane protein OmpA-like peptidoglycan-associated protein